MPERRRRGRPTTDAGFGMRQRLVDACWQGLLDASAGGPGVTVATICAEADCTPPTLYHHFATLDELKLTTCRQAFQEWADSLAKVIGREPDPAVRLHLRGRAYVTWGADHPAAYRALFLMPQAENADPSPGPGFDPLVADLSLVLDRDPADPAVTTAAFAHWSAVHGLTSLVIASPSLTAPRWEPVLTYLSRALLLGAGDLPPTSP